MISVSVAYALPERQLEIVLAVEEACTVAVAIRRSGILKHFPEINLATSIIGIYGTRTTLDANLHDGDRIEIYRPLRINPMQARLLRAKRKKLTKSLATVA